MLQALATDKSIRQDTSYVDRLYRLLPLEATGLYIVLAKAASGTLYEWLAGILLMLLVLVLPIYLWRLQGVRSGAQILVTVISFVVWAINSDTHLINRLLELLDAPDLVIALVQPLPLGMLLAFWTFLIPLILPVAPATAPQAAPLPPDGGGP